MRRRRHKVSDTNNDSRSCDVLLVDLRPLLHDNCNVLITLLKSNERGFFLSGMILIGFKNTALVVKIKIKTDTVLLSGIDACDGWFVVAGCTRWPLSTTTPACC